MNVDALRRDLESAIEGEVRFDPITRALYSTDASVYQIQPLGVVVVKSRDDVVRTVTICARHRCPLTMRGGGTSQAGQAIGSGIIVDTSKYFNRLLEVNPAGRWARVEPGARAGRAERGASPARASLCARHLDGEPRHRRRHDGQQLGRRAFGALREDHRPRARAAGRALGRIARAFPAARPATSSTNCAHASRWKARAIARSGAPSASTRRRSSAAIRKCCAGSAATTWTR